MAPSDSNIGRLTERDLADADVLVRDAGWNQTADDWRMFLNYGTVFALREKGRVIATAATLPYGNKFAWISMVLVSGNHQRQGFGTQLMRCCIDDIVSANMVPVLDATPAGRDVYQALGFEDAWKFRRMILRERRKVPNAPHDIAIESISDGAWAQLCEYDAGVFGADRSKILARLRGRLSEAELCVWRGGRIVGFLLGRAGRKAAQIGPLVAESDEIAFALLAQALETLQAPIYLDLVDGKPKIAAWLAEAGFVAERPLTRMLYRRSTAFQDATQTFAVAGPEFG